MAVLKTTSPVELPMAPSDRPSKTVPSDKSNRAFMNFFRCCERLDRYGRFGAINKISFGVDWVD
jgi:hypothetical protein